MSNQNKFNMTNKWTKKSVLQTLKTNPLFDEFPKEFEGKFILNYCIGNVFIVFYNGVGGIVEAYFMGVLDQADIDSARNFVRIAKPILQDLVNTNSIVN